MYRRIVLNTICGCLMAVYLLIRKTDVFVFLDGSGVHMSYLDIVERSGLLFPVYLLACYYMEAEIKMAGYCLHRNHRLSIWWIKQQCGIVFGILVCYISMAIVLFGFEKTELTQRAVMTMVLILFYAVWIYSIGIVMRITSGSMAETVITLLVLQVLGMGLLGKRNTLARYNPVAWGMYGYSQSVCTQMGYSVWITFFIEFVCLCYSVLLFPYFNKEKILRRISDEKNG
ncbi:MAG: hypothetical protein ACI4EK_02540 [Wujia sp.]